MLHDVDETIKRILLHFGGFDPTDIEFSFAIPDRDWSGQLGKPTINCYLYNIHERRLLREDGWQIEGRETGRLERRPPPLFFEMSYLITAWTEHVEDEHFLLWRVLETLMDHPVLPKEYLHGELGTYKGPIYTSLAQSDGVLKSPGEFWTALDNKLRPSLSYTITLARERGAHTAGAPVNAGGLRLRPSRLDP